jgi:signal transduction histidine kinase
VALLAAKETLPGQKELLDVALRQSSRLDLLIQGILHAFSAEVESLESFAFDPEQAPDAIAIAGDAAMSMSPAFKVAKVCVDLDVATDGEDEWPVIGEKVRFERVLQNLLGNALRYSPKGSTVTVRLARDAQAVMIAVEDEGPGVPEDVRERLFRKFSQGGAKSGSAGLGLYFCRITVERWGGTIGYEPAPSGGSRFWFRLRRADV